MEAGSGVDMPSFQNGFLSDSLRESPQKIGSVFEWKPPRELGKAERIGQLC